MHVTMIWIKLEKLNPRILIQLWHELILSASDPRVPQPHSGHPPNLGRTWPKLRSSQGPQRRHQPLLHPCQHVQTSLPLYPQTTSPIRKELIYGLVPKLCSDEGTWKGCLERYNGFLSSNFNNFVINVIRTKHRGQGTYRLPSIWKWDLVVINTLSSGNLSWRKFYLNLLFFILVLSSSLMNYIKSSNVSFFSFLFSGLRWHYISVILGLFFISVKP